MIKVINNFKEKIKILAALGKAKITLFVSLSSALGFILTGTKISIDLLFVSLGVFILSSGCSALNQWQEMLQDSIMNRTKNRPIPKGIISSQTGFSTSIILIFIGLSVLAMTGNYLVIFLGAFAIFWYNIVYTPLKMKSALAIIPGALVGSIPPFIGWTAGGGDIMNPPVWALALFFFIWQIPHFWLLLMVYEDDYKKAGFPVLTEIFSIQQLKRITFIWIAALAATCMMFPLFHIGSNNLLTDILLFAAGIWLIWRTKSLISYYFKTKPIRLVFVDINMYVLAVAMLLFIDKLILK